MDIQFAGSISILTWWQEEPGLRAAVQCCGLPLWLQSPQPSTRSPPGTLGSPIWRIMLKANLYLENVEVLRQRSACNTCLGCPWVWWGTCPQHGQSLRPRYRGEHSGRWLRWRSSCQRAAAVEQPLGHRSCLARQQGSYKEEIRLDCCSLLYTLPPLKRVWGTCHSWGWLPSCSRRSPCSPFNTCLCTSSEIQLFWKLGPYSQCSTGQFQFGRQWVQQKTN